MDNAGRIKKITDHLDSNYTTTYTYDMYNRLTSANSPAANRSYTHDAWGNLKTVVANNGTTTYTLPNNASGAPATNRLSSVTAPIVGTVNYSWDAAGT